MQLLQPHIKLVSELIYSTRRCLFFKQHIWKLSLWSIILCAALLIVLNIRSHYHNKAEQSFHMEHFVQIYYIKQIRYHLL